MLTCFKQWEHGQSTPSSRFFFSTLADGSSDIIGNVQCDALTVETMPTKNGASKCAVQDVSSSFKFPQFANENTVMK
jgi:hypothetical protein